MKKLQILTILVALGFLENKLVIIMKFQTDCQMLGPATVPGSSLEAYV